MTKTTAALLAALTASILLLLTPATPAQVTVPNTFTTGQVITAAQVNANFDALGTAALNRTTGGAISGNVTVTNGVTIDGVDISSVLGGTGTPTFDGITATTTFTNSGTATINGTLAIQALTKFGVGSNGVSTPAALAGGTTNDYAINATAVVLRLTADSGAPGSTVSGFTNGVDGRTILVHNIATGSTAHLILAHDTGSTASNRFYCPNNANFTVQENGSVWLRYDGTSSRWRVMVGI
jgi:hypothetical protein